MAKPIPTMPMSRKDSGIELDEKYERTQTSFFDLPPEIRTKIYALIFDPSHSRKQAYHEHPDSPTLPNQPAILQPNYFASDILLPLLTCRQFAHDAQPLAFSRTLFVVRNPYTSKNVRLRLTTHLPPHLVSSIRHIAFVAEADHFRSMRHWGGSPFGCALLSHVENLDIVLFKSSYWHYLFDFNTLFISLLRGLEGVERVSWVQNGSRVKPHFHTWFNRFVRTMLQVDRFERFGIEDGVGADGGGGGGSSVWKGPNPEKVWWEWAFDAEAQIASLRAVRAKKKDMGLEEYLAYMVPVQQALARSIAAEQEDPDPMSRTG